MGWLSRFAARRMMKHHGVEPDKYEQFSKFVDENDTARFDPNQVLQVVQEAQERSGGDPEELARILQEKFAGARVIRADGVTFDADAAAAAVSGPAGGSPTNSFDQPTLLSQLEAMRDQGVLSDEQFETQKKLLEG